MPSTEQEAAAGFPFAHQRPGAIQVGEGEDTPLHRKGRQRANRWLEEIGMGWKVTGLWWAPAGCSAPLPLHYWYHCLGTSCSWGLKRPREKGLLSLEEKKVQWGLTNVCKYLKGGCKEERGGLFPVTGAQWQDKRQWAQIKKEILSECKRTLSCMRLVLWNKLPSDASEEGLSLDILKSWLDTALSKLL